MTEMYNWFTQIIDDLLLLLPRSPFKDAIASIDTTGFQYVSYFIPIQDMINVLSVWIVSVTLFYLYKVLLRWLKVA